jgi:pyruvate,orthophosphate dikinase
MTSHAAVVARGMGKCCVAGCGEITVEEHNKRFVTRDLIINEGDYISLNGNDGSVYVGKIKTRDATLNESFVTLMNWADEYRKLKIRTNADNPRDATVAVNFGAEGIGLCRTEHMFFEEERIPVVRRMILSQSTEERAVELAKLLPFQQGDFEGIFRIMGSRPVTIRLLDPPLHEFLPHELEDIAQLAKDMHMDTTHLQQIVAGMQEFNPMLGHRGCRLAITWPEIYAMQVEAIIKAAISISKETGVAVIPEIMIPLIGFREELRQLRILVEETAERVMEKEGMKLTYVVGTMIEVPRAALTADEIAKEANFFSFGTNDLTQMTLGFSRDDSGKFIGAYRQKGIFEKDPFETIDQVGVGKLMKMAVELGRLEKPHLKIGICGEHGGEPKSVAFCHSIGLDYVSCSPFRVPIAKLAAAQAAIREQK